MTLFFHFFVLFFTSLSFWETGAWAQTEIDCAVAVTRSARFEQILDFKTELRAILSTVPESPGSRDLSKALLASVSDETAGYLEAFAKFHGQEILDDIDSLEWQLRRISGGGFFSRLGHRATIRSVRATLAAVKAEFAAVEMAFRFCKALSLARFWVTDDVLEFYQERIGPWVARGPEAERAESEALKGLVQTRDVSWVYATLPLRSPKRRLRALPFGSPGEFSVAKETERVR